MEVCESESLLAGRNMPSSTLASKDWELFCQKARHTWVVFLLFYQVERKKKSNKNKKELLHVCFCYCAPEESLRRHLAKERTRVTFI